MGYGLNFNMISKELRTPLNTSTTSNHTKSEIEAILLLQCEYMIRIMFEYKNIANDGKISKDKKKNIVHKIHKALSIMGQLNNEFKEI